MFKNKKRKEKMQGNQLAESKDHDLLAGVDLDKEMNLLNQSFSQEEARFEIVARKVGEIVKKWAATPAYVSVLKNSGDESIIEVSHQPSKGAVQTSVGETITIPVVTLINETVRDRAQIELEDTTVHYEDLHKKIVNVVHSLMVESILISRHPEWVEQFDVAIEGLIIDTH